MYFAVVNGLAEAFNKTLCNLLKKVFYKCKRYWHEKMEEALWAYRTTYRTPMQANPYSLVYGVEAVLPLERQIASLRISIQEGLTNEENAWVRLIFFQVGDQVLVVKRHIIISHQSGGKFSAKWDEPYIVQEVYSSGAYKIIDSEGLWIIPMNGKFMKKYYP
ncbi:uncharacterized protein [Nicotiana tomentosiformis]|uniref:uncharacterized protein n=1 Tax=Nicotiana tomentosiformis TaxID=4098 RepID=UPI00388C93D8